MNTIYDKKNLLVIKELTYSSNPDTGLVIPIAFVNPDGSYENVTSDEFPNGGIFISKGFSNINQLFIENEIFVLTEWRDGDEEEWKTNPRKQKHFAFGSKVEKLERNILTPIIKMSLPDISTGMINFDTELPNSSFFIEELNFIYGPFKAIKNEGGWILSPQTPSPMQLPTDYIAKIDEVEIERSKSAITFKIKNQFKRFIISMRDLVQCKNENIDYISDVRLISYFSKNGFAKSKGALGKTEAQKLAQGIEDHIKKSKAQENNERLQRLKKLLTQFLDKDNYGKEIVHDFLAETHDGRVYLDSYFEKNKDIILKRKSDELERDTEVKREKLEQELKEIDKKISLKKQELEIENNKIEKERKLAEEEIQKIKDKTQEDTHKFLLDKQKELTERSLSLEKEIAEKEQIKKKFQEENESINDLEDLKKEIYFLRRTITDLQSEKGTLEQAINVQRATLSSPNLLDKLTEVKTITSLFNGKSNDDKKTALVSKLKISPSKISLDSNVRDEYISYIQSKLDEDFGRTFSFDEISNLVVCTSQSFLSILSGPPGIGKTSTVSRFAKAMSLYDPSKNELSNFLNIPVGRAWVTARDILGFYNSLKDTYQPARTGLYPFLKNQTNSEFTKIVLLDEANLSSMEHYWSDFLGMCDSEGEKGFLDTGYINDEKERFLKVTDSLRFIATINNDATTEKLSPRLIDRVPVISLCENNHYSEVTNKLINFDGAIRYSDLDNTFNISASEAQFTPEEQNAITQIIDILSSPISRTTTIRVSQRKQNAIRRYCHVANGISNFRSIPLDYAVSQHILPLIEGYGSSFRERLSDLEDKLNEFDYKISKKLLKEIIDCGDTYSESYSFF